MSETSPPFGPLLRDWRLRRRRSQMDLAAAAAISQRHLSFLEQGRSRPSREVLLRLAEALELPPRALDGALLAAGYAPASPARALDDSALLAVRRAAETLLRAHEPWPALLLDAHWRLLAANAAVAPLLAGVDPALLAPPVNVLKVSLHPDGLAPRIVNFRAWRAHVLARLTDEIGRSADPALLRLFDEVKGYPLPAGVRPHRAVASAGPEVVVPLVLETAEGRVTLLSTTTVFGTAVDVLVSGLMLETFLPADGESAAALRRLTGAAR